MNKIKAIYRRISIPPVTLNYIAAVLIIISIQTPLISVLGFLNVFGGDKEVAKNVVLAFNYLSYFAIALKLYVNFEYNKARPNIFKYFLMMCLGSLAIYIADIIVITGYVKFGLSDLLLEGSMSMLIIPNFPLILLVFSFMYFFFFYVPKKIKQWQLVLFRICAIIPIFYIIFSSVMVSLSESGIMQLPPYILLLLTSKTFGPFVFILFTMLCQSSYIRRATKKYGVTKFYELKKDGTIQIRLNIVTCTILLIISALCWLFLIPYGEQLANSTTSFGRYLFVLIPLFLLFGPRKKPGNVIVEAAPALSYLVGYAILIISIVIAILYI